ncbi:glycosyltransferase family 92 protein F13G3.3-like [Lithobates pipiens]
MWTSSRHTLCTLSVFMSLAVIFYTYNVEIRQKMRSQVRHVATDTITALDNRTFIIAPYYEPRLGQSVRVIAILHVSVEELYCIFHCSSSEKVYIRAEIDLHSDRFGFPYGTADLLCAEPSGCNYTYMSFSSTNSTNTSQDLLFEVRNRPPPPISSNFTVCLSTLYGNYNNVLQVIQSIEMYKILGSSRITVYNTNCSQDVNKVLRHYVDEGILDMVPWPIDRHLQTSKNWMHYKGLPTEIGYFGQTAALNDCLYRNMYKSKFVLLLDIDEILLPVKDRDWSSMMESLQKTHPNTSVFRFGSHVFPTAIRNSGLDMWSHVPGVNILTHLLRRPNKNFTAPKMIVNPRDVFQTSIHHTLKYRRNAMILGQDTTMLFHCKHLKNVSDLIADDRIMRYNVSLVPNVDKVIHRLFPPPP